MVMPPSSELRIELARVVRTLTAEFDGLFSRETIERYVEESADLLSRGATVHRFIPRSSRDSRGNASGRSRRSRVGSGLTCPGSPVRLRPQRGRSQMAAAFLNHHARGRAHARSAGSAPTAHCTRPWSRPWRDRPRLRESSRSRSPTRWSRPRTSSSRWGAAMCVRSCPESASSIGTCRPPEQPSTRCARHS